jgi:hypothetical protein
MLIEHGALFVLNAHTIVLEFVNIGGHKRPFFGLADRHDGSLQVRADHTGSSSSSERVLTGVLLFRLSKSNPPRSGYQKRVAISIPGISKRKGEMELITGGEISM